ncbi:MAG TPA: beta/gamma crystallin-related protein, partial [Albitalea sp.]
MNTMHRSLAAIAVSLAGLSAGAAGAAEITLYEQRHFGGDGVTLHQRTPHVGRFNDRASSVLVRSGRWELCTDADFRGHCAEFGPGEYAVLDRAFNNRVSSAREVGHEGRRAERHAGRGAVTFFSQPGFGGRSFGVQGDAPDFSHRGYNDRAASMIVSDGVWEVCTDADYAG